MISQLQALQEQGSFNITNIKDSRIEAKINAGLKRLLQTAATIQGIDTSAFLIASATEKAIDIIGKAQNTVLTAQEFIELQHFIEHPPKAGKGLHEIKGLLKDD